MYSVPVDFLTPRCLTNRQAWVRYRKALGISSETASGMRWPAHLAIENAIQGGDFEGPSTPALPQSFGIS
jgi:hypothetical protein